MKSKKILPFLVVCTMLFLSGCLPFRPEGETEETTTETTTETTASFEINLTFDEISDSFYSDTDILIFEYYAGFPVFSITGYEAAENIINSFYEQEKEAFLVDMGSYKTEATENYNSFGEEGFVSPYSIETAYTMTRAMKSA
jgi:hypothetical protein